MKLFGIIFYWDQFTKFLKNPKISDFKKMHFPYYFLVKNQWFEKLTQGTALGGLSPPNIKPPPIKKNPPRTIFWVELQKNMCFNSVLIGWEGFLGELAETVLILF